MIMLGERGQAKTRMIRGLIGLLDEWMPIIATSEINDDPYAPVSAHARALLAEHGDDTAIAWIHAHDRYGEKLATPDTSIADLIGEVDPIKVAEGRYLSTGSPCTTAVPRTNRGSSPSTSCPTSPSASRWACSTCWRSATSRSAATRSACPSMWCWWRRPTPRTTPPGPHHHALKDRFGAQVRTHYPLDAGTEIAIVDQRPTSARAGPVPATAMAVTRPAWL